MEWKIQIKWAEKMKHKVFRTVDPEKIVDPDVKPDGIFFTTTALLNGKLSDDAVLRSIGLRPPIHGVFDDYHYLYVFEEERLCLVRKRSQGVYRLDRKHHPTPGYEEMAKKRIAEVFGTDNC